MNVWTLLFLLLPSPQAPAAPVQAAVQAKGTVRGHVYAMDNGAPLKRAQVTLRGNQRQGEPLSTVTDAQGAFEFRNVDAGNYSLFGSKTGYISSAYGQGDQQRGGGGTSISVRAGQDVTGMDLRLVRGGVISGVITDEDGEPMVNVNVQAYTRTYRRGQTTVNPSSGAATDDRGQYRIYNLPPGRYYIHAWPRGVFALPGQDAMVAYAPLFYPNATTLQDAQRVDLSSGGEASRIDMVVRPVPTVSVSGRVIDGASGKPATDSFISIMGAEMMRGGSTGAQVRPDGSFKVNGVLPGKARIMVMGRNREGGGRPYSRPLDVGHANIADLQVVLTPGTTVRGRVIGDGGTPPSNLRVILSPRGENLAEQGFGASNARVNPDLTFEMTNVQPGEYDVMVAGGGGGPQGGDGGLKGGGQGSGPFYVREVRKGTANVLDRGLTVGEGAAVTDVEVVLDFQPGVVAGKAADENGDPVSGTTVVLLAADPIKRTQERYFRTGRADASGNFKVTGVIPGDYLALLWPGSDPYQVQDPDIFGPLERHAIRVSVEKGATANQDLKIVSQIKAAANVVAQ